MQTRIKFTSKKGFDLSGILHQPDVKETVAFAVLAHCFTCTKSLAAGQALADVLAAEGIAALRFDFTGLGASKGQFENTSFSTDVDDIESAALYLAEHYTAPQILIGHSLGGTAILAAAARLESVKAVATIGSPASADHILHLLDDKMEELAEKGEVEVSLGGYTHKFRQCFVDDVRDYPIDINRIGKAVMVMHAPFDDTVSIDEATKIFSTARHPKSFVTLDKSDHLLSNPADAAYAGGLIANWAKYYIEPLAKEDPGEVEKKVVSSAETSGGFYNIITAGPHRFSADEPLSYGGTDLGPTPYDFLGAGLGSCTAMTLNGYARRKKLNLKRVDVTVTHERIHAQDCEDCAKDEGKVDQFTRRISLIGDLSEDEQQRLIEIADRCPVHKTLENEIKVVTHLAED